MVDTLPTDHENDYAVQLAEAFVDERTEALWVHKDLVKVRGDWETEAHIGPPQANEQFGDVESWAVYIKQFVGPDGGGDLPPFLTWNSTGLHAVLDYHEHVEKAGRLQWTAHHPFEKSPEWKAWMFLADGHAKGQKQAIEALEDRGAEIIEPAPADLMQLLRGLRATVGSKADTTLNPDGTSAVTFERVSTVRAGGPNNVDLPSLITIAIPVLKGHGTLYKLEVRVRASVDNDAHLMLRFSIPNAERTLEAVYADRVTAAKAALGDGFTVLRAAG